nr:2-oxoacid:acceptor oxidoreductase family protein [Candidatus Sigynarchaeota archaeon]
MSINFKDDVSIVLAGQAGQGIETIEAVLTRILKSSGYNVFATKEYMSRVRLGQNSTEIRISSRKVACYVHRIDILVPLDESSLLRLKGRVSPTTVVLCDAGICIDAGTHVDVPVSAIATEIGNKLFTNTVAIGLICGLFRIDIDSAVHYIKKEFIDKKEDIVNKNVTAVRKGHELGSALVNEGKIAIRVLPNKNVSGDILVNGAEAIALGAVAGGCNFIGSYPMSPSTAVLVSLAEKSRTFDIIAEQAEDEIAAINMAIGAWYAGARAMVTTSGGGFALMTEGISLSGMVETPV